MKYDCHMEAIVELDTDVEAKDVEEAKQVVMGRMAAAGYHVSQVEDFEALPVKPKKGQ